MCLYHNKASEQAPNDYLPETSYHLLSPTGQTLKHGFAHILGNRTKTQNGVKCQGTLFAHQQMPTNTFQRERKKKESKRKE